MATTVRSRAGGGALHPVAEKIFTPPVPEEARPGTDPSEHPHPVLPTIIVERATAACCVALGSALRAAA